MKKNPILITMYSSSLFSMQAFGSIFGITRPTHNDQSLFKLLSNQHEESYRNIFAVKFVAIYVVKRQM